jgi:hypothetical protein
MAFPTVSSDGAISEPHACDQDGCGFGIPGRAVSSELLPHSMAG